MFFGFGVCMYIYICVCVCVLFVLFLWIQDTLCTLNQIIGPSWQNLRSSCRPHPHSAPTTTTTSSTTTTTTTTTTTPTPAAAAATSATTTATTATTTTTTTTTTSNRFAVDSRSNSSCQLQWTRYRVEADQNKTRHQLRGRGGVVMVSDESRLAGRL